MKANILGFEDFEREVEQEIKKIDALSVSFLHVLGNEMETKLNLHLIGDWYEKYYPKDYKRRTDYPSLGKGLLNKDYKDIEINGKKLTFTYLPSGEHEYKKWETRNGDELIEWIQTGNLIGDPPKRPFWNNFVFDMETSIMDMFVGEMKPYTVIYDRSEQFVDLDESRLEE